MEALNAASLTPVSVLSDRREKPRKVLSIPSNPQLKFTKSTTFDTNPPKISEVLSKSFTGGIAVLSSVISGGVARALTYEEALQQSVTSPASDGSSDIDLSGVTGFFYGIVSFATDNPAILIGGVTLLGVPLVLSQVLKKDDKAWGVDTAKSAYAKLAEDANAQLVDIRAPVDVKAMGSPDLKGLKKKAISIVYRSEDKPGFLKKLALKFKDPENTTLFILDKFDGNSELVAELVTVNGFKGAYAIKDGAEGGRGWMASGLPWLEPKKTLSFDISNITEAVGGALGESSDVFSLTLGLAAATGIGLLAFTEVETLLQLLGSAALVQFVSKKLLFAENRKETLQQVDDFLTTKIAPKEFVGEIKQIGLALLPISIDKKALPAPTAVPETPVLKAEKVPEATEPKVEAAAEPPPTELKAEAAAEPPAAVNSTPNAEVKSESLSGSSRPLSPYYYYPDFKPPTSPSPSQP